MASNRKVRELRFPVKGVVRRTGHEEAAQFREPFPTPWACNVRSRDTLDQRNRGGSRPGLTKLLAGSAGTTIAEIQSLDTASSAATTPKIAVLVDSTFKVVSGGAISTPTAKLLIGGVSIAIAGTGILLNSGAAPAAGMLCVRGNKVYCLASSGIVVFDTVTGIVDTLAASSGTLPTGVTVGGFYRDRLVLVKDNWVYCSRQGDPTDFDLGRDVGDSGRAMLFQLAGASEIGADPTAFIPFQDQTALVATAYGLWVLRGDPATGTFANVSKGVGIINGRAWCKIEDARVGDQLVRNGIAFVGPTGLFVISPNGDGLQGLSADAIPEELVGIADTTTVRLAYLAEERGIHIYLTPNTGTGIHWFYGLDNPGFWPMALQADHEPLAICEYNGGLVLGCSDGYLRYTGGDDDDGEDIESHLLIGPIRLGGADVFGILTRIHGMVAVGSGSVAWRVIAGETAEEACDNGKAAIEAYQAGDTATAEGYASASGTWAAGRSTTRYPRVRAMWMCVWLRSTAKWAYEGMSIESTLAGAWR